MDRARAGGFAGVMVCVAALLACPGCRHASPAAESAAAGDEGFRDAFSVARSGLGPTGANRYWVLRPGARRMYEGGGTILTITVLDQTRVIDGVTTRVVEEREVEGGELKEVSRNFFAIDREHGDVYYFGEEVDIYKGGRVVSHDGAWRSGEKGARFGLMMPARPAVGDRFYQEIAPGVAMDRAEVVSLSERLATRAGVFEGCVVMKETTPLEKGESRKWYAPEVGLVADGELKLVSYTPGR